MRPRPDTRLSFCACNAALTRVQVLATGPDNPCSDVGVRHGVAVPDAPRHCQPAPVRQELVTKTQQRCPGVTKPHAASGGAGKLLTAMARRTYQEKKKAPPGDEQLLLDLVRYGLEAEPRSVRHIARRLLKGGAERSESFRHRLGELLVENAASPTRAASGGISLPVEPETHRPLASIERGPRQDPPILLPAAEVAIEQLVSSRSKMGALVKAGIEPPRTVLLTGPPGVGKSMTAAAVAVRLDLPLVTVELTSLMSSFLGKTGQNLSLLLEHARETPCVLFLDEFDAVAKRRDDITEIGELKRLVNMLLLELDRWPVSGLLVAATNHPQLLDPAVERRFDVIVDLQLPDVDQRRAILTRAIERLVVRGRPSDLTVAGIALALDGKSGADLERIVSQAARASVLDETSIADELAQLAIDPLRSPEATAEQRISFSIVASENGMTQRQIADLLGVSHPTVGKWIAAGRERFDSPAAAPKRRGKARSRSTEAV
jgi:DNA-binding transcriptional regulator YiaG